MSLISQRLVNSRLFRLRCRWGCARYPEVSGYALNHAVIIYASRPVLRTICYKVVIIHQSLRDSFSASGEQLTIFVKSTERHILRYTIYA